MIAYIHKNPSSHEFKLTITVCEKPCSGNDFNKFFKIFADTKREAKKYCKLHNITPHNF